MTNKLAFLVSVGVAVVLAFSGLLAFTFPVGATTTGTAIDGPERSGEPAAQFTATGTSDGDRVAIAIRDRTSKQWWTGTEYQDRFARQTVAVTDGRWSLDVSGLNPGPHSLSAASFLDDVKIGRSALVFTAAEPEPQPALASLIMSRSLWGPLAEGSCVAAGDEPQIAEGSLNLIEVAELLDGRGVNVTHSITVDRHLEDSVNCVNGATLTSSWATLAELRDVFGWSAISHGRSYVAMNELDDAGVESVSCGSVGLLADRGFVDASAMFSFPNNGVSLSERTRAVAGSCFSFLREYGSRTNSFEQVVGGDSIRVRSVSGGSCNTAGCAEVYSREYVTPGRVLDEVLGGDGTWGVVQFYKIVDGTSTDGRQQWDCTSSDPDDHWTNRGELYCLADFLAVVDGVAAAGVEWVTPADVAGLVESGAIG